MCCIQLEGLQPSKNYEDDSKNMWYIRGKYFGHFLTFYAFSRMKITFDVFGIQSSNFQD